MREPVLEVEKYRWLGTKVKLDLLSIEDELMEMSELIKICGEITAEAIDAVNVAKDHQNEVRAWAAGELRKAPTPSGKQRSETQVESELDDLREVVEAGKKLNAAKLDSGLWQARMESLQTKSNSIRSAVELIKAGFVTTDYLVNKRREELHTSR